MNVNTDFLKNALEGGKVLLSHAGEIRKGLEDLGLDPAKLHLGKSDLAKVMALLPARATLSFPLAAATFGAGFVTGAAAASLLTPMRGDELRAAIRERFQQGWQRVTGQGEQGPLDDLDEGNLEPESYDERVKRAGERKVEPADLH